MLLQISKLFFDLSGIPQWIYIPLVINMWVGIVFGVLALINWFGTDRSGEIYEAEAQGYSLTKADFYQLQIFTDRSDAFAIHILCSGLLGGIGTWIAHRFVKIPPESLLWEPISEEQTT